MLLFRQKSQNYCKNVYLYQMFWPLCASQICPRPIFSTNTQMAKLEFVHQCSVKIILLFRQKSQNYRKNVYIYQMFWQLCASQICRRPIFSTNTQMSKLEFVHQFSVKIILLFRQNSQNYRKNVYIYQI